jgi:dTMP kinase
MIKPEGGLERINNGLREVNRLDKEKITLHQLVYEGYQKIIKENSNKTIIAVDASQTIDQVLADVSKLITSKIKEHYGE